MSIKRIEIGPRMSQAVVHGSVVYLAGQVALGDGVAAQTKAILEQIDALLAAAGTDKTKILATTIYLADISKFGEMNAVWDGWVAAGHTPARATVEAALATPDYLVEIVVTAAV